MKKNTKLHINVSPRVLPRIAGLLSNTVILGANAYLITSTITQQFRDRKRERVKQSFEIGAQIASALAGLTKVIVETVERGQTNNSL
jgi:hypothetical protein